MVGKHRWARHVPGPDSSRSPYATILALFNSLILVLILAIASFMHWIWPCRLSIRVVVALMASYPDARND